MATSLQQFVQKYESGGSYTTTNPTSGASGAYQFLDSTWRGYAGQIGVDTRQYPTAASAPPAVQDAVFDRAVAVRGLGDWTCPGCNPKLTDALAARGGLASFSSDSGSAAASTSGDLFSIPSHSGSSSDPYGLDPNATSTVSPDSQSGNLGTYEPGFTTDYGSGGLRSGLVDPQSRSSGDTFGLGLSPDIATAGSDTQTIGQSLTDPFGIGADTAGSVTTGGLGAQQSSGAWWDWFYARVGDMASRAGLIFIGVVLIGAAAAAFAFGDRVGTPNPKSFIKGMVK